MIQPVCKDLFLLSRPSKDADISDLQTAADLMDTLKSRRDSCVGMAANMIGVLKRIIVFSTGPAVFCMMNPVITARSGPYEAEEGCLSLSGTRKTTRYKNITVSYQDLSFHKKQQKFTGYTAQIIQHEIDHTNGIVI
ncbi:MAG: peptide deformylase [Solobacterium sp.]|nr:peptide deformylase [Solobacterium sp.]